jgi:hypothetical protein
MSLVSHRDKIQELEKVMLAECEQVELKTTHYFAHGSYVRELFIPKGVTLTGKIHRHSCINVISKGRILVVTGEDEYEISAPHTFVSGPGVKKAGHALEDTIWINVHPWDGVMSLEEIEHEVITPSYEALEKEDKQCLG